MDGGGAGGGPLYSEESFGHCSWIVVPYRYGTGTGRRWNSIIIYCVLYMIDTIPVMLGR